MVRKNPFQHFLFAQLQPLVAPLRPLLRPAR